MAPRMFCSSCKTIRWPKAKEGIGDVPRFEHGTGCSIETFITPATNATTAAVNIFGWFNFRHLQEAFYYICIFEYFLWVIFLATNRTESQLLPWQFRGGSNPMDARVNWFLDCISIDAEAESNRQLLVPARR